MPPQDGRQTRDVAWVDGLAIGGQFCDGLLHVDSVPMDDGVEGETECPELFFLTLPQCITNFATISVIDFAGELVPEFLTIQLNEYAASEVCIINIVQDVQGFDQTTQMHERLGQGRGTVANLENAHDARSFQMSKLQGSGEADQVLPVLRDQPGVDHAFRDHIQGSDALRGQRRPALGPLPRPQGPARQGLFRAHHRQL